MEPRDRSTQGSEVFRTCARLASSIVDSIAKGTNVIVAAQDTDFRYVYFNDRYRREIKRLAGKDVTVGMSMMDLFSHMPEQLEVAMAEWRQAMFGKTTSKTLDFGDPGRRRRTYHVDHNPVRDEQGRVIGVVEVAYDISARRQSEEEKQRLHEIVARERDRLSALLGSISDEIWFADTEGRFVLVNPSGAREFGIDVEDVVDVREMAAGLEVRRADGTVRPIEEAPPLRALRGEIVRNEEEIIRSPATGELRHRQVSSSPVKNAEGGIIGSVSVVRDITALKRAREKIRNLASFPEYNTNPVMEIDLSGSVTYANPATRQVLRHAGLDERDTGVFVPPGIARILEAQAKELEPVYQCKIVVKDRIFAEAITLVPHLKVARIYASDITQRERAEQALAASRNLLQSIIDNSPRFIHVTDLDGRYIVANKAVADMLGVAPEEMKGKTRREIMPEATADRFGAHDREVTRTKRPLEFEESGMFKGRLMTFLTTKFPLFDSEGRLYAIAGMSVDISDLKKTEADLKREKEYVERLVQQRTSELTRTQAELAHARRLADIGALAATVAHELRNPLAAIGMAAYNIARKARNRDLDKHIASIEKKVDESEQIINNLLFYSRIRPPNYEIADIGELIDEVVEAAAQKEGMIIPIRKHITFGEGARIEIDPFQIKEVLNNIVNNAYDAVEPGKGEIEILCRDSGGSIEITIKDNGGGIDRAILPSVFDPFFSTKAKGTGLGLSICQQIMDLHGGSISIESEVGEGTAVVICLPRTRGGR